MRFDVIYSDPNWRYRTWGKSRTGDKTAERHYKTEDCSELMSIPVGSLAADNCCLSMWVTAPLLQESFAVMEAWGFEYKTIAFTWLKKTEHGNPQFGLGHWTRSNAELCLLGTRGNPKRKDKGVSQVVECPRGKHSAKPHEIYNRIERLVEGPYIELFARNRRHGWVSLGDHLDNLDLRESILKVANDETVPVHIKTQATMDDLAVQEGWFGEDE